MATWKKVLVSGSAIHVSQLTASVSLQVGTNQVITTNPATTFLSGSFSGSFSGNGTGLTGVTATPTFPTTAITNLAPTDKFFVNDDPGDATSGNKKLTYQNLIADLAGTNLTSSDSGDSLSLTPQISVTGVTGSFTGSLTGTLIGTASWAVQASTASYVLASNVSGLSLTQIATGSVSASVNIGGGNVFTVVSASITEFAVAGTGVTIGNLSTDNHTVTGSLSVSGSSLTVTGSLRVLGGITGSFSYSGLTNVPSGIVSASVLSSPAQGQAQLTTNGVAGSTVDLGLETGDSPTFAGLTISTNALAVNNTNGITTTQTTFPIVTSNATNITLGGSTATVTIPGNLTVQGVSTIISSSNLTISDKFVFISSGSTSSTNEGGIIVSNAAGMTGSAFYYEGTNTRWALAPAVGAGDTAAAPNSFLVSVSGSSVDPTGDPLYGGSGTGYGNLYVNTTSQDIFIYV